MPNIVQHKNPAHAGQRQRGLSGIALKLLAAAAMLLDTAAVTLLTDGTVSYQILRFFGQTAPPLLCFCLCEGYFNTRSRRSYALRLFLLAAVVFLAELFFLGGMQHCTGTVSLMLIAFICLGIYDGVQMPYSFRLPVIAMLAWWAQQTSDGGAAAILFTLSFAIARRYGVSMQTKAGLLSAVCCLLPTMHLLLTAPHDFVQAIWKFGILLPVALLPFYRGRRGGGAYAKAFQWAFYILYPVHLAVFFILRHL